MEKTIKKVLNARVYCVGIRRRCRKIENQSLKLGDFPLGTSDEEITARACDLVFKEMKTIHSGYPIKLSISEDGLEERDGMIIRTMTIGRGGNHRGVDITAQYTKAGESGELIARAAKTT